MTVTVKHPFVSTVPDSADTSLVRPSNWNADHTIVGLGTAAELNAGVANGVATLDGGGTVPLSQIPASIQGTLSYQGTWNASTNTPTLASGVGTKGYYYVVSVAGSTNLDGITDWNVGDMAVYSGTAWQQIDNTDAVTSVNGLTGTVVLTTTNVAEGTNEYFTTARARASVSAGTGISYNSTTGVITNSSPSAGGDVVGPASATDNAIARFDTTTGKLIQNSVTTIDDTGNAAGILSQQFSNGSAVTVAAGKFWYNGSDGTWNMGMGGGNITQQVGEELFVYGKASAAVTDSPLQIVYQTGVVGASGHITFAPTVAGITDGNLILGCATENLATNDFGRITTYGTIHGITTNGTAFGETWADGDIIWYNPVTGNPTKTKPTAPNIKVQLGIVTHAGSGGSGSFFVLLAAGSTLGGTDSNVNIVSVANNNLLQYNSSSQYWTNVAPSAVTGVGSVANSLTFNSSGTGDASGSTFNGSAAKTISYNTIGAQPAGTYVTSVAASVPSFLSVSGSPITSSGTLAISYSGTALPVANGGTGLTAAGTAGYVLTSNGTAWVSAAPVSSNITAQGLFENANTISANYTIGTNNNAVSAGPITVASGVTVTVPSGSVWTIV